MEPRETSSFNYKAIAKFSDNDLYQLECIKDILDSFQEDCEVFLRKFSEKSDVSFTFFKELWLTNYMGQLFEDEEFSNMQLYGTYLYNIISKFLNYSESKFIQVGALYMIYVIHKLKYFGPNIKIRLTKTQYFSLQNSFNTISGYGFKDVGFAFHYLRLSGAFKMVADLRCFGLENKYFLSSHSLKDNIMKMKNTLEAIPFNIFKHHESFNLKNLEKIDQEYEECLKKFVLSPQCNGVPMMERSNILGDLKQHMKAMEDILNKEVVDEVLDENKLQHNERYHKNEKYTMKSINYSELNKNLSTLKKEKH